MNYITTLLGVAADSLYWRNYCLKIVGTIAAMEGGRKRKITLGKALNAGTGRNLLLAEFFWPFRPCRVSWLVTAQEPPQIVQYRQRIAQVDKQIAQWNNYARDSNPYWYTNNDPSYPWYQNNAQFKEHFHAYVARQKQRAAQGIAKLQDDRAWQQWGIQNYYNSGGAG